MTEARRAEVGCKVVFIQNCKIDIIDMFCWEIRYFYTLAFNLKNGLN